MNYELKPCPFCGGEAKIVERKRQPRYPFAVECSKCHASTEGTAFKNDEFNIKEWNTRADTGALTAAQEENERLRTALNEALAKAWEAGWLHATKGGLGPNPYRKENA